MYCFIPAAGFGKRMGDLTRDIPKPLLKVGEYTLLYNTIQFMIKMGFSQFVINTHYKAELIHKELEKIKNVEVVVSYERENILGTAGGIKKAFHSILKDGDYFICINPDIIYKLNFNLLEVYNNYSGKCLLFLAKNNNLKGYTELRLKNDKVKFETGDFMFIGLSIMRFSIFKDVQLDEYYDLADIFKKLSLTNQLDGKIFQGDTIDLGDKVKYKEYISNI